MPEMPPLTTPWYLDKTLWIAILAPVLGLISKKLGVNLDPNEVVAMVMPIVIYIVMSKWKAATALKAAIAATAASAAITTPSQAAQALRGP